MKKAYLLVYSDLVGTREQMKAALNSMPEVITWRYDLPHAFYLISENTASEIATALRGKVGEKGRFIITEVTANKNGWLSKDSWYLLNEKQHKPK